MQPGHLTLASPSRRACRQVEPRNHRHPCGNKKVTNLGCCEEEYVHLEPDGWQHKNPVLELINCLVHRKVKATLILSPVSIIFNSQKCRWERDGGKTLILLPTVKSFWGPNRILAATGHYDHMFLTIIAIIGISYLHRRKMLYLTPKSSPFNIYP